VRDECTKGHSALRCGSEFKNGYSAKQKVLPQTSNNVCVIEKGPAWLDEMKGIALTEISRIVCKL